MPDDAVRILLVEDDPDQAALISQLLAREGYTVSSVATGAKAVDAAEIHEPHLVFMDIGLEGGMDGVEAAVLVRKRTGLPVVFLTAHAEPETLDRAREAEPFGYLIKPIQPEQLRATVEIALHKARKEAERQVLADELAEARETIAELRARIGEGEGRDA